MITVDSLLALRHPHSSDAFYPFSRSNSFTRPSLGIALVFLVFSLFFTVPTASARQTASSSNLGIANDYNLFVLQNASQSGSDSQGRVAVGGNLTLSSYDVAGSIGNGNGVNLVVGGNLETTYGQIHGSSVVTGTIKLHDPTANGNVSGNSTVAFDQYGTVSGNVTYGTSFSNNAGSKTTISGTVTQGTTALPFSFSQAQSDLLALTDRLKNTTANGTVVVQYAVSPVRAPTVL